MNFLFIMTDTQPAFMVGAYGQPEYDTPNLDRLAANGIRFNKAYTACPVCTPARGAIFSGLQPQVNGAWCNNLSPYRHVPLWGEIFSHHGYRRGYTGKWHLDGTAYFGDGEPGGGFEGDWWYDGKRYREDLGEQRYKQIAGCGTIDALREADVTAEDMWAHRVADRAIDFMGQVGNEPFVCVASFDEPHGPCWAPPEYYEAFENFQSPMRPNYRASTEGKPRMQQVHASERTLPDWEQVCRSRARFHGCNAYVDREIGRVIDACHQLHGDDTMIIYTSDHGDMLGSHGLASKGPMVYEEVVNIPLLIQAPGEPRGEVCDSLVSHIDLLPTLLDYASIERPEVLHGRSLRPAIENPSATVRATALISFNRFAINHDSFGGYYPIRATTDGRFKLAINLLDTDELYDLEADPYEMTNLIDDAGMYAARDRLHDALLAEMDAIRDPMRGFVWMNRSWRSTKAWAYSNQPRRPRPRQFDFLPTSIDG